jgi:shikimate kinase
MTRDARTRSDAPEVGAGGAPKLPDAPAWTRVVLVGLMGSGKTTVGRLLAKQLGWRFVDLDDEVEAAAGREIEEIFRELGEPAFRELEARAGKTVLAAERTVLAPGGGWSLAPGRLEGLPAGTLSVWLQVSAETAVRRATAHGRVRPLIAGADPIGRARALLAEREGVYGRARLHLDAERASPAALARAIARHLEGQP